MTRTAITAITAASNHPPFGNYSPGILIAPDDTHGRARWLVTAGQLGVSKDGAIPEDVEAQAVLCFESIGALLAAAGMDFGHLVRLIAYVTRREDFPAYMRVRDRYVREPAPVSTLLIVGGFTRPEMRVEVEAMAVRTDVADN